MEGLKKRLSVDLQVRLADDSAFVAKSVDVVDELRSGSEAGCSCFRCRAADEIERLRAGLRLARLELVQVFCQKSPLEY